MTDYYADNTVRVISGDCLDVLATLPDASVDSVVTDPPYGLEFMGKEWDRLSWGGADQGGTASRTQNRQSTSPLANAPRYGTAPAQMQAWHKAWATECLRVLKPGGHLLAFGGTRTSHRLACAIEDAGFEIRDSIAWLYGSGFPKSLDVSKAIDKAAGETGTYGEPKSAAHAEMLARGVARRGEKHPGWDRPWMDDPEAISNAQRKYAPATPDAERWQGWGTALKPAHEPVVVARKPLAGTVAASVLAHGTGALNVDATRIGADRWPSNVVLDESQAAALDEQSGTLTSGANPTRRGVDGDRTAYGEFAGQEDANPQRGANVGGASRFFYTAKAASTERVRVPKVGGDADMFASSIRKRCVKCGRQEVNVGNSACSCPEPDFQPDPKMSGHISHPTVKPLSLMRWLVRLVTPPGGTVLEPFAGSGTTVEACILEGFRCIAIEREADYLPLIRQRIHRRRDPVEAVRATGEDAGLFDLLGGDA